MPSEKAREIASAGGKASQASDKSHVLTLEERREGGRKGGLESARRRRERAAARE